MTDEKKANAEWMLRIDELNVLIAGYIDNVDQTGSNALMDVLAETITGSIEDYLLLEYSYSWDEGLSDSLALEPYEPAMYESAHREIDGKNFTVRIAEYVAAYEIDRDAAALKSKLNILAVSDGHRVRQEARQAAGEELDSLGLNITKTWRSVKIPTTRDSHWMLDGTTIPINGYFETALGSAKYPGGFGIADEDVNCLCYLQINIEN